MVHLYPVSPPPLPLGYLNKVMFVRHVASQGGHNLKNFFATSTGVDRSDRSEGKLVQGTFLLVLLLLILSLLQHLKQGNYKEG